MQSHPYIEKINIINVNKQTSK